MTEYSIDATLSKIRRYNRWYSGARYPDDEAGARGGSGMNVIGYFRDESGWGAAGRGYVRALTSLGIPLALLDLSALSSNRSEDSAISRFDRSFPHDVNLVCIDAGQHFSLLSQLGPEFFDGKYTIGAWAWELPHFPEGWYDRFAYYDEIWVGTSFIANALAPIAPVPVVRVPPVLTPTTRGCRERGRRHLGVADEFIFLFIFDFHSHLARKNPLAAIDAFITAFTPSEPARLVIKCVNAESDIEGFTAMQARARGHAIAIHAGYWSREEVADLMAASDAYVSLHRAEGTGLTISDAMSAGKPVIATGWSGNTDFMNVSNSFPVRFELVTLQESVGPYRAGEQWAEPSVAHASELMRQIFADRGQAAVIGAAARRTIEGSYSEAAIAELIASRWEVIKQRHKFGAFRHEMRAFFAEYQQLIRRIRSVVSGLLPAEAIVAVVSKGDDAFLDLGGPSAWHFPRTDEGVYAGYHPADTESVIAEIDAVREHGATHLLLPGTAFWWLDHYEGLKRHLERTHREIASDAAFVLYRLATGSHERWGSSPQDDESITST